MTIVFACCVLLLLLTTVTHYEVLRLLSFGLPKIGIPVRAKLIIVIVAAFGSHAFQMLMYGGAYYVVIHGLDLGGLTGSLDSSLANCLYFSAETFTSLGFGDILPTGPARMIAGVEALNGLLLIGWSASFTYLAMERFWLPPAAGDS
jgi:Ion channel